MGDSKPGPWRLSAPESLVLLHGQSASGSEAFKLGLMELVASGALVLGSVEQRMLMLTSQVAALRDGPRASAARPRALEAIFDVYARTPHRLSLDGAPAVAATDLTRAAMRDFGSLSNYVSQAVLPSLAERGLFEARLAKILWIFNTTRWQRTPAGDAARDELNRWLLEAETQFSDWATNDPQRALAYAAGAGAALLLMPAILPELRRLRLASDDDGGWYAAVALSDVGSATPGFDFASFDFSSIDAGVLASIDSAMNAIDAAVDAGGGSSSDSSDSSSSSSDGGGSSSSE